MDLDLALRMEQPTSHTDDSTAEYKAVYEKWERSNRIGLIIILDTIPETFRGVGEIKDLKQFFAEMDLRFASSDKAEISTLLYRFSTIRYHGKGNTREYALLCAIHGATVENTLFEDGDGANTWWYTIGLIRG